MTDRPPPSRTLAAIAIVSLLLGTLGGFATLYWFAMLALQPTLERIQFESMRQSGAPQAAIDGQREMNETIDAAGRPYQPAILGLSVVKLGICLTLIAGGVAVLLRREAGRDWLLLAARVAIPFETIMTAVGLLPAWAVGVIMRDAMANAQPGMELMLTLSMAGGLAFTIVWLIAKLAFFVWAVRVLPTEPT